ncbi:MAG: hypothetical protein ACREIS_03920 [Nitrospiraceae bacterium]
MRQQQGRRSRTAWSRTQVMAVAVVLGLLGFWGCAGDPGQAPVEPTLQQIRSDSDVQFEKLKQEERERGTIRQ